MTRPRLGRFRRLGFYALDDFVCGFAGFEFGRGRAGPDRLAVNDHTPAEAASLIGSDKNGWGRHARTNIRRLVVFRKIARPPTSAARFLHDLA